MLATGGVRPPRPPASGRGHRFRRPGPVATVCWASAAAAASAPDVGGAGSEEATRASAAASVLEEHLRRLWDHHEVPVWHRQLYERRYFGGGCSAAVLRREAEELVAGSSKVQVAAKAVAAREAVLRRLEELRERFNDADFAKLGPRRDLNEALLSLRSTSVAAVEALAAWRRSVAPPPGRSASGGRSRGPRPITSPCQRGARWPPPGCTRGDYLQRLAQAESVVRRFGTVLELKPEGETDPFLLLTASAANNSGKMRPPPITASERCRVQSAQMLLLEDLVGFSLVGETDAFGSLTPRSLASDEPESPGRASVHGGGAHSKGLRQTIVAQKIERLLPFLAIQHQARGTRSRASIKKASVVDSNDAEKAMSPTDSRNKRRVATVTMRKMESMDGGLSMINELSDLGSPSNNLSWKTKPHNPQMPVKQPLQQVPLSRESSLSDGTSGHGDEDEESDDKPPRPPTIDLMRINAAFRRYSVDGYISQDDLVDCLKHVGFPSPNVDWVDESFETVTNYGVLDAGEFMLFISAYEDHMRESVMDDFQRYDEDGNGRLEQHEFEKLFRDMRVEPMSHVLEEILAEVDQDGSQTLDFDEFFDVIRLLQEREGFTKSEHEMFLEAFKLFDRDKSGEMDEQELFQVLCFLGYEVTREDVSAVTMEVDFDGTGTIDQHEFMLCMRKLREREIQSLKTAMTMHDIDMNGTINPEELQTILYSIGYMPDDTVISEVLSDLGLDRVKGELTFSLLWQFMCQLRMREGLCRSDSDAVEAAFNRYASGTEVNAVYLSKILRYMGFSFSFEERQSLIRQVDVDSSGALCLHELRKLFRICREQSAKAIKHAFQTYSKCLSHNGEPIVPLDTVPEALRSIGCLRERQSLPELGDGHEDGLGVHAFFRIARRLFAEREREVRSNHGYCERELQEMHRAFREFDSDNSGLIRNGELVNLVRALFPEMASDPKLRPQLKEIIREADVDGNGELDFEDFLRLMSTVYELRSRTQLEKEKKAVQEAAFLPHEVHQFRDLFMEHANRKTHQLDFPDLEDILSTICPLGDKNLHSLYVLYREALVVYQDGADVREVDTGESIDFPEFLWLMKQVIDTNFAGVIERTRKTVAVIETESKAQSAAEESRGYGSGSLELVEPS